MKKKIRFSILAVKLLMGAVFFGALMCILNNIVGYVEFKKQMEAMYGTITRQLAYTGSSYIEGDYISSWLYSGPDEHWGLANEKLQELTETGELAFIYVTVVAEDYKSRTYIFDTINELVNSEQYQIIPFGKVSSLEKKDSAYIERLRNVIEKGQPYSTFEYKKGGGHVTSAVPVKDSNNRVVAIMSAVKPMKEIALYRANYLRSSIWSAVALTIVFLILYTSSLYFGIIKPIVLINDETLHFAENHGELTGKLKKIKNIDEIGTLAKSVEKMSKDMSRYISELTNATAEKERLGAELNVAKNIQAEMLPRVFPPYENHPELELYATMEPAKEVGGDFYDFFIIDDDHFCVVVGDVSGKGVPAALFMVIAKTLLKDAAMHSDSPADIFSRVNDILCEGNATSLFVTCWLGILTISTGELQFANAGHTHPVILHNNEYSFLKSKPNLMLGAMSGMPYKNHDYKMDDGDRLFLYTDGVTEASNPQNELYGAERLLKVLDSTKGMHSKEILSFVRDDIEGFVNGAPQFDDITMLEMAVKHE